MNFISSISGTVTVSVIGADIPGFLDYLATRGVVILSCEATSELEAFLTLNRSDYRYVSAICAKQGVEIRTLKNSGVFWKVRRLFQRRILVAGLLFYFLIALILPTRVLFVRVVGNKDIPDRLILEAAANCGICFGASRQDVRSERMKNKLLEMLPNLQWAGVNTVGCVAEISVRERQLEDLPKEALGLGHVVAGVDGFVISTSATRGTLLCVPGQAVAAGDILISGYTDCGLTIRAEQAEGEVYAVTKRTVEVITPAQCRIVSQMKDGKKKISLLIGKKRIILWKDSGFWDATCDRMYEENYITLPGGFQLPFGWSVERCRSRELLPTQTDPDKKRDLLTVAGESYLRGQMVAGTIRTSDLSFDEGDGFIQMTGEYGCEEMIGFRQRLEIGEINGKSD